MISARKRILLAFFWYSEALHGGALKYCVEQGWEPVALNTDNVAQVAERRFDGVIGMLPPADHPIHAMVVKSGTPVVELSHAYPENTSWARCPSDGSKAGALAAEHLARRPVASFAFVSHSGAPTDLVRAEGFAAKLRSSGDMRPFTRYRLTLETMPEGEDTSEKRRGRLADFLANLPSPSGVFASVDATAKEVYDAAKQAGLKVPGDIHLMGFGNRELVSRIAPVPITTIGIDYGAWGYAAAAMMDGLLSGKIAPGTVAPFPPDKVIARESTGGESGGDALCARALEIMNANIEVALDIDELAARMNVSPSTLKRAFQAAYGMGVAAYYRDMRLEVAKGLLAAGNKVDAVAAAVGFDSPRAFRAAFIKATGVKPGDFEPRG